MDWLLILLLSLPGQPPLRVDAGQMASRAICMAAGNGIARALVASGRVVAVGVACRKRGVAA